VRDAVYVGRCARSTYNAVARDFPLSARQVLENLKNRAAEVSRLCGYNCLLDAATQLTCLHV
jgi:hypothetical protein